MGVKKKRKERNVEIFQALFFFFCSLLQIAYVGLGTMVSLSSSVITHGLCCMSIYPVVSQAVTQSGFLFSAVD